MKCSHCNKQINPKEHYPGTGYVKFEGDIVCYKCCAELDKKQMRKNGKIVLYLDRGTLTVSNWPGTLKFGCINSHFSNHNWNLRRIDVWFIFEGYIWWGFHIGDNTDLVHCKKTRKEA